MNDKATGGPIEPGRTYVVGEHVFELPVAHHFDWSKAQITVHVARYWRPIAVELLDDIDPAFAAQFAAHRGPGHQFALLDAGFVTDAVKWICGTCNTGGDL